MKPMNKTEEIVLKMLSEGKTLRGWSREVWIEMTLREVEKTNKK